MRATNAKRVLTGLIIAIMIALMFPFTYPDAEAQTSTNFTTLDKFSIPELNGTISFGLNGSCSSATLVNNNWVFTNLKLNGSQPLGNLTVSATNSSMTVLLYRSYNFRTATIRYNAQGVGTQTVGLGLNHTQTQPIEWSVSVPTVAGIRSGFLAEGDSWKLLPNDFVLVFGLTGNVSVSHFNFYVPNDSNLPFYQQHLVIIITAIGILVTVAIALLIRVKVRS